MKLTLPITIAVLASVTAIALADAPSATVVYAAGTPVMTVRTAAGGYSAEERASHIQNRLNLTLGMAPIYPSDVTVTPSGQDVLVMVKDRLVFTADPDEARANDSTPAGLAITWADELKQVLPNLTRAN